MKQEYNSCMKITALEPQKNKDRINVFIDGQFSFGVHIDVAADFLLRPGLELTQQQQDEIKIADGFRLTYDKAIAYLAARPRSKLELRRHLRDKLIFKHHEYGELTDSSAKEDFKETQERSIDRIVQLLEERGYVDDAAFAKWWIDNRRQFRPRGKRLLLVELQSKGVSLRDIETALTTPDEEGHFQSIKGGEAEPEEVQPRNEVGLAMRAAGKYARRYRQADAREFKQRVGRYLSGKGFDWETIEVVVKRLWDEREQDPSAD
jgi:regulatory protein